MSKSRVDLPVIVLGAGGHAKVLIDLMMQQPLKVLGIVAPNMKGYTVLDIPVIGNDEAILAYSITAVRLVNGIGSTGDTSKRIKIFEQFKASGYTFATLIHPAAVVGVEVQISEGVQIMAGAIIQCGSRIGPNAIINTRAVVDHDCVIGSNVHLAPGVTLSGGVTIADGAHIGTGATVIQNIHIGKNSIIGAGAVIIRDVPENTVVVGVPGRIIK